MTNHLARRPRDVGIILTYRCHGGCKHCLYNCGPRWEGAPMTVERLEAALELVAGWPRRPQVHLTGGEPFLHFDLLMAGTRAAAELGLTCYVETSGSWCLDEEMAVDRLATLRSAGLDAVLVSCSPFHAERIPPIRTLRAIRAALQVFGSRGLIVYLPQFLEMIQKLNLERPTPLSHYEKALGLKEAARTLWDGYGIISGGRAGYKLGHLAACRPAETYAGESCAADILFAHHSHLDLYGNAIPAFCGGLTAADWRHDDLLRRPYPRLVELLIARGPHGLYKLARAEHGYRALPAGYAGKCHLCVDVRWHLVRSGQYPELRPAGFYENI
jgi:hypothetical protein